jgi:uncharacterized FlgJ-related protein
MKIIRIKKSDLDRLINEQIDGLNAVNLGRSVYDMGKSAYDRLTKSNKPKTSEKTEPKPFSLENLKAEIIKQGIKYPNIALAQAFWESEHFKSNVFKENNNLFGMKQPKQRKNVATGTNRNHATYNNWVDSVKDYKLMQDELGYSSLNVDGYYKKLDTDYCPGCNYSKNIKSMIKYNQKKGITI